MAPLPDGLVLGATIVAGILGLIFAGPQLKRTFTTKTTAGLSVASYGNGAVSYTVWTMYFVYYERYLVALSVAVPGILWTLTLTLLTLYKHRGGEQVLTRNLLLPAAWLTTVIAARTIGETWFNMVLSTSVLWAYLPALWAVCRAHDVSGVSVVTWVMAGTHSAAVVIAGWPLAASVLYGSFGLLTAAGVVGVVTWRTRHAPGPTPSANPSTAA